MQAETKLLKKLVRNAKMGPTVVKTQGHIPKPVAQALGHQRNIGVGPHRGRPGAGGPDNGSHANHTSHR